MKSVATIISYIFQPLLIPLYGMLLFFYLSPFALLPVSVAYKLLALGGTFFFTALIPGLSVLYMMKTGQISDIFISNRRQRTLPYVYTLISYLFWIYFLWKTMLLSTLLVVVAAGAVVGLILVMFINTKWKISAHLTAECAYSHAGDWRILCGNVHHFLALYLFRILNVYVQNDC